MKPRRLVAIALVILTVGSLSGCSKDDNPVTPPSGTSLTVSGKVTLKKQITVPPTATFTVLWVISAGSPDYEYVYGNGTIDFTNKTFSIVFTKAPPDSALNNYTSTLGLGVGMMYVSDLPLGQPRVVTEKDAGNFYGAVNNADIIYIKGNPKDFSNPKSSWPSAFPSGYSVGKGVKNPGTFDSFVPADPTNLELIISDDPNDVENPNWT
jgi:hypothetical protein